MNLFLTLLIIILFFEGINRTEITVRCYITDCKNKTQWPLMYWLTACILTASWQPYVCEEHWDLFEQIGEEDEIKMRERVERRKEQ